MWPQCLSARRKSSLCDLLLSRYPLATAFSFTSVTSLTLYIQRRMTSARPMTFNALSRSLPVACLPLDWTHWCSMTSARSTSVSKSPWMSLTSEGPTPSWAASWIQSAWTASAMSVRRSSAFEMCSSVTQHQLNNVLHERSMLALMKDFYIDFQLNYQLRKLEWLYKSSHLRDS